MSRRAILYLLAVCVTLSHGRAEETSERIKGEGAQKTSPAEFKYLVKIMNKETDELIGSGLLLNSKVILGIGYNYMKSKPSDLKIVLGEHDRTDDSNSQTIDVKKIKIHPDLIRSGGLFGDIALFKLSKKPKIGKKYLVETFGVENIIDKDDKEIIENSKNCVVPGYGVSKWEKGNKKIKTPKQLKKFVPQIRKQEECIKAAGGEEYYIKGKNLCSINDDLTAICLRDGGTPLLCKKGKKMKLYGLAFAGSKFCDAGKSFFARTSMYYSWIERNAKLLQK